MKDCQFLNGKINETIKRITIKIHAGRKPGNNIVIRSDAE